MTTEHLKFHEKRRRALLWLLLAAILGWTGFILTRSMKTAAESSVESLQVLQRLQRLFPHLTVHTLRKLAHFSEFFLLGLPAALLYGLWKRPSVLWPMLGCALIAAADETIQLFFDGRSGEVRDVALDCLGAACAVICVWLLLRRRPSAQDNKRTKSI